jgi:hypothetical protein
MSHGWLREEKSRKKAEVKDNAETPSSQRWRGEEPAESIDDHRVERWEFRFGTSRPLPEYVSTSMVTAVA